MKVNQEQIEELLIFVTEQKSKIKDEKRTSRNKNWQGLIKIGVFICTCIFTLGYGYRSYEQTTSKVEEFEKIKKENDKKFHKLDSITTDMNAKIEIILYRPQNNLISAK